MKASLAYQHKSDGSPCCLQSSSDGKKKVRFPCITIYLTEENADLIKDVPSSGKATIQFKTKKVQLGEEDYGGVEGEKGCIELEVHEIEFPSNQKAMLNMTGGEALDEFMKSQKPPKKSSGNGPRNEDDEEDESY